MSITTTIKPFDEVFASEMRDLTCDFFNGKLSSLPPAFYDAVKDLITSDATHKAIIENLRQLQQQYQDDFPFRKEDLFEKSQKVYGMLEDLGYQNCGELIRKHLLKAEQQIPAYITIDNGVTIFSTVIKFEKNARINFYARISKKDTSINATFTVELIYDFRHSALFVAEVAMPQ